MWVFLDAEIGFMPTLCRDCLAEHLEAWEDCPDCGSRRLVVHDELDSLAIAHIDCDAFFASVEKRDDPSLADRPVLVGARRRGVVAAACYVARRYGAHSAMPMYQALRACPDAVVIPPNLAKYRAVSREIRALFNRVSPRVEPVSIDEAFLDLSGTERLHHRTPAQTLAALAAEIERSVRITVSIGLSYNKFLAKIASAQNKPRGFSVIGRGEARGFLASQPVGVLPGVGPALRRRLEADGIATVGDLQVCDEAALAARYGRIGARLARFAHGEDDRPVDPHSPAKSLSAETTFPSDIADVETLSAILWRLSEKVAARLKAANLAGDVITLKLRTARFRTLTRRRTIDRPTQLAEIIFRTAQALLDREADGRPFRLIGVGVSSLDPAKERADADLFGTDPERIDRIERAIDAVRARFGEAAIAKGRGLGAGLAETALRLREGKDE